MPTRSFGPCPLVAKAETLRLARITNLKHPHKYVGMTTNNFAIIPPEPPGTLQRPSSQDMASRLKLNTLAFDGNKTNQLQDAMVLQKQSKWKTFATIYYSFPHTNLRCWRDKVLAPSAGTSDCSRKRDASTAAGDSYSCPSCPERAKWWTVRTLAKSTVDFTVVSAHP
jgi:hypothetical protein